MLPNLDNPLGVFLYLILRNDWSWKILSAEEKSLIQRVNRTFNAEREDYANPEQYGTGRVEGGENWDSLASREKHPRGPFLLEALQVAQPKSVLEIGPGPGFFTKEVCGWPTITHYTAVDVGSGFLDYLRPRLKRLQEEKKDFAFELLQGELKDQTTKPSDFVLLLSCVHHIPDRENFFREIAERVAPGGYIFCFDPSHYASRWLRLLRGVFTQGFLKSSFYKNRDNLSTHHFCTIGEYRRIIDRVPNLELADEYYIQARKMAKFGFVTSLFPRIFSVEMGVLIRKRV